MIPQIYHHYQQRAPRTASNPIPLPLCLPSNNTRLQWVVPVKHNQCIESSGGSYPTWVHQEMEDRTLLLGDYPPRLVSMTSLIHYLQCIRRPFETVGIEEQRLLKIDHHYSGDCDIREILRLWRSLRWLPFPLVGDCVISKGSGLGDFPHPLPIHPSAPYP